jgi:hypothetical protein
MYATKYVLRNITVLNIILLAAVVFVALYTLLPQLSIDLSHILPDRKRTPGPVVKETAPAIDTALSLSEYAAVSEENLFHPDRKIPPEKKAEEKPLPKPDFVLYGTVLAEDVRIAYLEDLKAIQNTTGRGRRQVAVRQGDVFSGFTLKKVNNDGVVLVRGEETLSVKVNQDRTKKNAPVPDLKTAPAPPAAATPKTPSLPARGVRMTPAEEKARAFFTK